MTLVHTSLSACSLGRHPWNESQSGSEDALLGQHSWPSKGRGNELSFLSLLLPHTSTVMSPTLPLQSLEVDHGVNGSKAFTFDATCSLSDVFSVGRDSKHCIFSELLVTEGENVMSRCSHKGTVKQHELLIEAMAPNSRLDLLPKFAQAWF